jgi:hypothetical protein
LEQLFRHRIEKAFEKVGKNKATFHKQEGGFVIFAAFFLTRSFRYACRKAGYSTSGIKGGDINNSNRYFNAYKGL